MYQQHGKHNGKTTFYPTVLKLYLGSQSMSKMPCQISLISSPMCWEFGISFFVEDLSPASQHAVLSRHEKLFVFFWNEQWVFILITVIPQLSQILAYRLPLSVFFQFFFSFKSFWFFETLTSTFDLLRLRTIAMYTVAHDPVPND